MPKPRKKIGGASIDRSSAKNRARQDSGSTSATPAANSTKKRAQPSILRAATKQAASAKKRRKAPTALEMARRARDTPAAQTLRKIREGKIPHPDPWCEHAVRIALCVVCKPELRNTVLYITGGGTHMHRIPNCRGIIDGQKKVERRGGSPEQIEAVKTYSSSIDGRDYCKICMSDVINDRSKSNGSVPGRAHRWSAWSTGNRSTERRACWECGAEETRDTRHPKGHP